MEILPSDFSESAGNVYQCPDSQSIFYCYESDVMDYGWDSMKSLKEALESTFNNWLDLDLNYALVLSNNLYEESQAALNCLEQAGYDGVPRCLSLIKVFALPNPDGTPDMSYGFVLKQDNNGTTYVASPFSIPALEKKVF